MTSPPSPDVFKTPLMLCECMFEWMHEVNPMYSKDKSLKDNFFQKYNIVINMHINMNNKHADNNKDDINNINSNGNRKDDLNHDNNNEKHDDHQDTIDSLNAPVWDWDTISKKMYNRGVPYSAVHCAILWKYIAYGKKYSDHHDNNVINEDDDKEDAYYQPFTAIKRFSLCKNSDNPQLFLPSLPFDCKARDVLQSFVVSHMIVVDDDDEE